MFLHVNTIFPPLCSLQRLNVWASEGFNTQSLLLNIQQLDISYRRMCLKHLSTTTCLTAPKIPTLGALTLRYSPAAIATGPPSPYLVLGITAKTRTNSAVEESAAARSPPTLVLLILLWLSAAPQRAVAVVYWDKSIPINSFCVGWLAA